MPLTATCELQDLSTTTDKSRPANEPSHAIPKTIATVSDCETNVAIEIANIDP